MLWEREIKSGTYLGGGSNLKTGMVMLNNAFGQPQTNPHAVILCRIKRIKYLFDGRRVNDLSIVSDAQCDGIQIHL